MKENLAIFSKTVFTSAFDQAIPFPGLSPRDPAAARMYEHKATRGRAVREGRDGEGRVHREGRRSRGRSTAISGCCYMKNSKLEKSSYGMLSFP